VDRQTETETEREKGAERHSISFIVLSSIKSILHHTAQLSTVAMEINVHRLLKDNSNRTYGPPGNRP